MSELSPLERRSTLSERAADRMRALIASGQWPVGGRIPSEHELVDHFDVSRNTVREAVRALVHTGLLEARVGDGTYVMSSSELRGALMRRSATSPAEDVLALRFLLEEYAAGEAARYAMPEDVRRLEELLDAVSRSRAISVEEYAERDLEFHREVIALGRNSLLVEIYDHLEAALMDVVTPLMIIESSDAEHERLHRELVGAIAARDEVQARHASSLLVALTRRLHKNHTSKEEH
ncbi:GntR family transcriptional regulator [Rhodococcus sp. IEGM 1381]|uniref:FadR/GntR family transcriptional regulator n=1 Tax=Rhodococcus sp. IEGM 1381 TaxID=3047085 RepID=UPI0024B7A771|nr:GntR family transcriptional regulator [Rhodococcus sp. IEGM 1381]MDI9897389.1 GntR family transcriptional regulator [Rhodococcus sp. IEGM 1381]